MATFSVDWTTGTTLHSSSSVSNGGTAQDDLNLDTLGYYRVHATLDFDIASGSPAGDVVIELFGSSDAGTAVDTIAFQKLTVPFAATGNKKISVVFDRPWVRTKITNNTGVSVTYVAKYAGLKQVSA